ncbi:malic acid transport protein [Glarea lozoyensis ATCC 20868]|uniref:Malic acid transport protein n=1 Tax=Glarea lozoyensis (strain ATCC 20868 / MF5171) TaxID=1116229 RepID=S3D8L8_GLAL2|nr:malic acid transport protein [Glarea lozoyensis ATCC 20868]EPE28341.1 malic acid transport protein [Glarea lozoyensis ATCC 20868]
MSPSPSSSRTETIHDSNSSSSTNNRTSNSPNDGQHENRPSTPKSLLLTHASHITWNYFPLTMSTLSLSVLLSNQPFTFPSLLTLGTILFVTGLVLFVLLTFAILIRFYTHPGAFANSLHHPTESFFVGSWWVSVALLLNCIQSYGVPSSGPWLVTAMEVLFWVFIGAAILVAVFQYHVIYERESLSIQDALPAWILPAYPFLVTGNLAGAIVASQAQEAGLRIWIAGLTVQGLGWMLAIWMYSVYLARLISGTLPEEGGRPGMYVAVGPAAYTSAALASLGSTSKNLLPNSHFAQSLSSTLALPPTTIAAITATLGLLAAIFTFLIAFFFFLLSTLSILRGVRKMSFTLNWWAFIFPNAGMTIALLAIAEQLGSKGMQGVGAGATVVLVGMWFFVAGSHILAVVRGGTAGLVPWVGGVNGEGRGRGKARKRGRRGEREVDD